MTWRSHYYFIASWHCRRRPALSKSRGRVHRSLDYIADNTLNNQSNKRGGVSTPSHIHTLNLWFSLILTTAIKHFLLRVISQINYKNWISSGTNHLLLDELSPRYSCTHMKPTLCRGCCLLAYCGTHRIRTLGKCSPKSFQTQLKKTEIPVPLHFLLQLALRGLKDIQVNQYLITESSDIQEISEKIPKDRCRPTTEPWTVW